MFDATLLESSPRREPVLGWQHWVGALFVGAIGGLAGHILLPMMFNPSPEARMVGSVLLGLGVMCYELMLWYVLVDSRNIGLDTRKWSMVLLLLNFAGFLAYLIYSARKTGDWKRAALPVAYLFEGFFICSLVLVPFVYTQPLPDGRLTITTIPPPRLGSTTGNGQPKPSQHHAAPISTTPPILVFPEPVRIRAGRTDAVNAVPDPAGASLPGPPDGTGIMGVPFGQPMNGNVPPPPPKTASKPPTSSRVYQSSTVEEAKLIYGPKPEYPQICILAHIQGTVELKAIISKDGTIQELNALSGNPLLIKSAEATVARWRYQPTLLNGEPVEVETEINVNFKLDE